MFNIKKRLLISWHTIFSEPQASQSDSVKETVEPIPTYSAQEERQDSKLWRTVIIGEQEHRINMKSIEPYQKVISHGGTLKEYFKENVKECFGLNVK